MKTKNSKLVVYGKESKKDDNIYHVLEKNFQNPPVDHASQIMTLKEFNKIENLQFGKKPFLDLFVNNNFSIWWLIYPQLFLHLVKNLPFITNFSKFIEKEKPNLVQITGDYNKFEIIKQVCFKNDVKFQYSKVNYFQYKIRNNLSKFLHNFGLEILTRKKIRFRKRLGLKNQILKKNLQDKILFVAGPSYRRKNLNFNTGKSETGEFLLDNIVNMINSKKDLVGIDIQNQIKSKEKILVERLNDSKYPWFPIELLLESKATEHKDKILKKFQKLISSKNFQQQFTFEGINYWSIIEPIFRKMQSNFYIPFWVSLIFSLEKVFSESRPKIVILPYETGPIALSFIAACRKLNIKTVGIQHGIIYDFHESYCHSKFLSSKTPDGFPLPDILLLYGELVKDELIKKGYPEKNLMVLGNPAFFESDKIRNVLNKKELQKKYNIDGDPEVILFTTTGLSTIYENMGKFNYESLAWQKLLKHFGDDKNYFIVLKTHPGETTNEYEKILKEIGVSNAIVSKDNLFELIFLSSLVVSTISTTMIDALCLKKPVMQIKLENVELGMPFKNFDAVYETNYADLEIDIKKILKDDQKRNQLIENGNKFIKKYYNIPPENIEEIIKKTFESTPNQT